MEYRIRQFSNIKGLISLGGLSECGKSEAGIYLKNKGYARLKIIDFEHQVMRMNGYDLSNGIRPEHYDKLYEFDAESSINVFLNLISNHLKIIDVNYAVLESMYRSKMATYLKELLGDRMVNVYVKAPLHSRVTRQCLKKHGSLNNYDLVMNRVKEKDNFKRKIGVESLENIADYIIDNSISKEDYLKEIDNIAGELMQKGGCK